MRKFECLVAHLCVLFVVAATSHAQVRKSVTHTVVNGDYGVVDFCNQLGCGNVTIQQTAQPGVDVWYSFIPKDTSSTGLLGSGHVGLDHLTVKGNDLFFTVDTSREEEGFYNAYLWYDDSPDCNCWISGSGGAPGGVITINLTRNRLFTQQFSGRVTEVRAGISRTTSVGSGSSSSASATGTLIGMSFQQDSGASIGRNKSVTLTIEWLR